MTRSLNLFLDERTNQLTIRRSFICLKVYWPVIGLLSMLVLRFGSLV
jgi:hypothetical protein